MKKIILLGYMGCGKSTIAKLLAKSIGISCLDLDEIIEKHENSDVNNIFSEKGEIYFRKLEHQKFSDLIQNKDSFVLGVGGGTPCYSNNHLFLNFENVVSIYLKASVDTLFNRLSNSSEKRPLLAARTPNERKEFIAKNLFDRSFFYNQARFKISVDGKSTEEIINEIKAILT